MTGRYILRKDRSSDTEEFDGVTKAQIIGIALANWGIGSSLVDAETDEMIQRFEPYMNFPR